MFGNAFGTATFFDYVNLVHGSRASQNCEARMQFLLPADAFLVVATLGTGVLIEIAAFILMGLI